MAELRIVAGAWRGRRIKVPPAGVRPTADRVREAWASIVLPHLDGARVVDLCAGSGALGLEALSRGAAHCDFVEKDAGTRTVLEQNIATLGAGAHATVHRGDAMGFLRQVAGEGRPPVGDAGRGPDTASPPGAWDVAFADPPYDSPLARQLAERWLTAPFATIFGLEHAANAAMPPYPGGRAPERRTYGITALTFYRMDDLDPQTEEQP